MKTMLRNRWEPVLAPWRAGLLTHRDFRLLWLSSTVTSFGGQITMLALPLMSVVMLEATPAQLGTLVGLEALPFSLLSLHAGVLIDRVRKLPIVLVCEAVICLALLAMPLAALADGLSMPPLSIYGFVLDTVFVFVGSAAQIHLIQLAGRERLIEANSLFIGAESTARQTGPGLADPVAERASGDLLRLPDLRRIAAAAHAHAPRRAAPGEGAECERPARDPRRPRARARPPNPAAADADLDLVVHRLPKLDDASDALRDARTRLVAGPARRGEHGGRRGRAAVAVPGQPHHATPGHWRADPDRRELLGCGVAAARS